MANIAGINIKNIPFLKKVEESFNSNKDRDSNESYKREEKKRELPKDVNELLELLQEEVKKFEQSSFVKNQGLKYKAVIEENRVFVVVKSYTGKILRKIQPDEFMELSLASSDSSKGNIINSVY